MLRLSFERQFWAEARYPTAELLGARTEAGKIVGNATRPGVAHCDFLAQAVYGTHEDYELVEDYYQTRTIALGRDAPIAIESQPLADRVLSGAPLPPGDAGLAQQEVLRHANADLARAREFPTVYIVEAISWGHPAWLDWRCR
jgi:hypothetical protein